LKISTRGEYGIRAMLYVAMNAEEGPVTSREIAAQQAIPEPYLRQILASLAKDGLIHSNRGPQGGHVLARPASDISLRSILVALEGHTTSVDHILAQPCSIGVGTAHCAIREVFLEVKDAVERLLESTSLDSLAARQKEILEANILVPHDVPHPSHRSLPVVSEKGEAR